MTTFLLIRHAAVDAIGNSLVGRTPGVHLNTLGEHQINRLVEQLSQEPIQTVYSSPLERAWETAEPLAAQLGLRLQAADELAEIDYGEWTGKSFEEIASQPQWRRYNTARSTTRIPQGELMLEAQLRVVSFMQTIHDRRHQDLVALVSHGDVIRSALLYFLGMPLDLFGRIEIGPASLSVARLEDEGPVVLAMNCSATL